MSDDDLKTSELNIFSLDRKNKYTFSDATGLIPGLASISPVLKLESSASPEGGVGSIAIPRLLYKIQGSDSYMFLSWTIQNLENKDVSLDQKITAEQSARASADTSILSALSAEQTERKQIDSSLSLAISNETLNRTLSDNKISSDLSFESSQRVAGDASLASQITVVVESVSTETKRATDAEAKLDSDVRAETIRATDAESKLDLDVKAETARATGAESKLDLDVKAETARALGAESVLQSKIDFIAANTDQKAIDSIQELLNLVNSSDGSIVQSLASLTVRVSTLETIVANLRGKA